MKKIYSVDLVCHTEENVPECCKVIFVSTNKDIEKMPIYVLKELLAEEIKNNKCESIGYISEISEEEFYEEYNTKLIEL